MDKAQFERTCATVLSLAKKEGKAKAVAMAVTPQTFFLIGAAPFPRSVEWDSDRFAKHEQKMQSVFGDVMLEILYSRNACDRNGSKIVRDRDLHGQFYLAQFNHNSEPYAPRMVACFELRMNQFLHDVPPAPDPKPAPVSKPAPAPAALAPAAPTHATTAPVAAVPPAEKQSRKAWWKFWSAGPAKENASATSKPEPVAEAATRLRSAESVKQSPHAVPQVIRQPKKLQPPAVAPGKPAAPLSQNSSRPASTTAPAAVRVPAKPVAPKPLTPAEQWEKSLGEGNVAEAWTVLGLQPAREAISMVSKGATWQPPAAWKAKFQELLAILPSLSSAEMESLVAVEQAAVNAHAKAVMSLVLSGDGRLLASGGLDGKACLWSLPEMRLVQTLMCGSTDANSVDYVAFSSNNSLVTVERGGGAKVWDPKTGTTTASFQAAPKSGHPCVATPDGKLLLAADGDQTATVWSLPDGKALRKLQGVTARLNGFVIIPGGTLVAAITYGDPVARVFDLADGKLVCSTPPHGSAISVVAAGPSGLLATADSWGRVHVCGLPDGKLRHERGGCGKPRGLVFASPDRILAVGEAKTLVWSLTDESAVREGTRLAGRGMNATTIACDATVAVTEVFGQTVASWMPPAEDLVFQSPYDGRSLQHLPGGGRLPVLEGSGGEIRLITGQASGGIRRWELAPIQLQALLHKPPHFWMSHDLSVVKRLARSRSLSANQQKLAAGMLLLLELYRDLHLPVSP